MSHHTWLIMGVFNIENFVLLVVEKEVRDTGSCDGLGLLVAHRLKACFPFYGALEGGGAFKRWGLTRKSGS